MYFLRRGHIDMEQSLVSIITPTYNSEKFIEDTIKSVLEQNYTNWEMIIVDDCSKDKTVEFVENLVKGNKNFKLISLKENVGAGVARNIAIKKAVGKYIAFLDSDDIWDEKKLEKQIKFMEDNSYYFTFTDFHRVDENWKIIKKLKVPKKTTYKRNLYYNVIQTSTVIYNQEKLGKIYMPEIRKRQDYGLFQKILEKTEGYGLNEDLMAYKVRKQSLSFNKKELIKWQWKFYREILKLGRIKSTFHLILYIIIKIIGVK